MSHHLTRNLRSLLLSAAIVPAAVAAGALAQEPPLLAAPSVDSLYSDPVEPGDLSSVVTFSISEADSVAISIVAPVPNPVLTLRGPTGTVLASSAAGDFSFGAPPSMGDPGGVFGVVFDSGLPDGEYTIDVSYDAAGERTVVAAFVTAISDIQSAIVVEKNRIGAGQEMTVGVLLTDRGQGIGGVSPTLGARIVGQQTVMPFAVPLRDDGTAPDGEAGDGLSSGRVSFPTSGLYELQAEASFERDGKAINRTAIQTVEVYSVDAEIIGTAPSLQRQASGCVAGLDLAVDVLSQRSGDQFIVAAGLAAPDGSIVEQRRRQTLLAGTTRYVLSFDTEELRAALGGGPTLSFIQPELFRLDDTIDLQDIGSEPLDEALTASDLCRDPILLGDLAAVTPVLTGDFIGALDFVLPVDVENAGTYQLSFTISDITGGEVGVFSFSRFLGAGEQEVSFRIDSADLQSSDGPFSISSGLIIGPSGSLQRSNLGSAGAFERWQFLPVTPGDLNNDGIVDGADRDILGLYRNVPALVPGDRRDLTDDGVIDIRDVRAITRLR